MKEFVNSLFVLQKYQIDHDNIKTVLVARNGNIKIVYDNSIMSVSGVEKRMGEYGVDNYSITSDWRSNSIFVDIK
jgi:hypothetical protein